MIMAKSLISFRILISFTFLYFLRYQMEHETLLTGRFYFILMNNSQLSLEIVYRLIIVEKIL